MFYKGKKALITGGAGFIGLNIIKRLLILGAEITTVDNIMSPEISNLFATSLSQVNLVVADIRDENKIERVVQGKDIIFNLAGKSGAADSNRAPLDDLDINCKGHLTILEACRHYNPRTTVLFPSSRLVYGKPSYLPVDENHPLAPDSIYAVHKLSAERYHLLYGALYGMKTTVLRISNPYGPMQFGSDRTYGIANQFIHSAVKNETITIFGDGNQHRDYLFIDDLVQAFLIAGMKQESRGKIYNIGNKDSVSLANLAQLAIDIVGSGRIAKVPWPAEYRTIETGNYQSDITRVSRELEWYPLTDLREGITRTAAFYRTRRQVS